MSNEKPKASFVTFYSFKGGVGRSMALINTAAILAGRGFRVLVVDLDLEAPGLSYLNPEAPDDATQTKAPERPLQLGFVDLLSDAKERGVDADFFKLSVPDIAKLYTRSYKLPKDLCEFPDGSLNIMPAGKFDSGYVQRCDALNLRELYQQGLGEPLIRAFKKKIAESGVFDYVLVDSRTGFSDEAGICTRDLPDLLMILSGLNRQNVEGSSQFLKALRVATNGKAKFQMILSPVPNGEDALLDIREAVAQVAFSEAWGSEIDLSLQIPYHPRLALTEELIVFGRRHGGLFGAYREIEQSMLESLGHTAGALKYAIEGHIGKKDYVAVLRDLRRMVRLDQGPLAAYSLAFDLASIAGPSPRGIAEGEPDKKMSRLDHILTDKHGGQVVEFIIDHLPPEQIGSASRVLLKPLREKSPNLADRLFKRMVEASPNDGNTLGNYALFLEHEMQNYDLADAYFKRAIEATATPAWTFRAYGAFLESRRDDTDMADVFYKLAIESDPHDANHYGHYAIFLARRGEMAGAGEHFKRAIALDPKNATNLGNYALFLGRRGDKADAKEYYKRAIDADPKRPSILTNYAVELEDSEDLGAAEAYYKRAINVDPKHAYSLANYGEFLLDFGRLDDGEKTLLSALENLEPAEKETTGEVCFSLWLVSRMKGEDALNWERAFKFVIQNGFEREPWDFDRMLAQAQRTLQPAEFEYAKALAAAFLDASKVPQLEQYDRWRALEPLDPTSLAKAATS